MKHNEGHYDICSLETFRWSLFTFGDICFRLHVCAHSGLSILLYSPKVSYTLLVDSVPWLSNVEKSWRLSGKALLAFPPSSFVGALRNELTSLTFSVVSEICDVIKAKVAFDSSYVQQSGGTNAIDVGIVQSWACAVKELPHPIVDPTRLDVHYSPFRGSQDSPSTGFPFQTPYGSTKKFAFGNPIPQFNLFPTSTSAFMPSQYSVLGQISASTSQNVRTSNSEQSGAFNSIQPFFNAPVPSQYVQAAQSSAPPQSGGQYTPVSSQYVQAAQSSAPPQSGGYHSHHFVNSMPISQSQNPFLPINIHAPVKVLRPWQAGYKRIRMADIIAASKAE
jgi:hypothetical protein